MVAYQHVFINVWAGGTLAFIEVIHLWNCAKTKRGGTGIRVSSQEPEIFHFENPTVEALTVHDSLVIYL